MKRNTKNSGGFGSIGLRSGPNGVYNLVGRKDKCMKTNTRRQQMTKLLKFQHRDSDAKKQPQEKTAKKGLMEDTGSEQGFGECTSLS